MINKASKKSPGTDARDPNLTGPSSPAAAAAVAVLQPLLLLTAA